MTDQDTLRHVDLDGWRLRTWDTGQTLDNGKHAIGYILTSPQGKTVFEGEDFGCSPLHSIDSDECLRGILAFLTLRPGDTDAEYFKSYTQEQQIFAECHAEELSYYAMDGWCVACGLCFSDNSLDEITIEDHRADTGCPGTFKEVDDG